MVILVVALAGCGDGTTDERTATTAAAPRVTPFPTGFGTDLVPGTTYTTQAFRPKLRITLREEGWKAFAATPTDLEMEPETTPPVQDSGVGIHRAPKVFDAAKGGEIPGDAVAGPPDFADWLTNHPHLKATKPKRVEAVGLKGVVIDVRVKSAQPRQYRDCGKVEGDCVVMIVGGVEPLVYGSNTFARWLVLEHPEGQVLIEQFVEPAKAFGKESRRLEQALSGIELAD